MNRSLADWLAYAESVHPRSIEMGLTRVRSVAERLGLLPWAVPSIIVAGTNGKGSVTCTAEQILVAHGRRVGAGFSPHLHRFNERVRIDGREADDALLARAFAAVDAARAGTLLTYFEFATLVSLWAWRESAVDCAVLEIGLGGRLDAFNIVDASVAVVTSIGLDHQEYLGDTQELIGAEKAGVMRAGQRVVLGRDMPASVLGRAVELGCQVMASGREVQVDDRASAVWMHAVATLPWSLAGLLDTAMPTGLAPHNAALAVMAAAALMPLRLEAVRAALARAILPGRTERVRQYDREFVLDIAHNADGAIFLADRLAGLGLVPAVAVLGNLQDKDTRAIASALVPVVGHWVATATSGPRGQDAGATRRGIETALGVRRAGAPPVQQCPDIAEALKCAVRSSGKDDVILVFGSFAVVAAARAHLGADASGRS